jgi:guanine nucleotide-binding protein G(i) subunit alpha
MKIIHQNGYSEEELYPWRITVYKNLIESAQSLIFGMMKFGLDFELLKNKVWNGEK